MTKIKKRRRGRAGLAAGFGALAATGSLSFATTSSFAVSVGRHSHPQYATVVFTPTWQESVDAAALCSAIVSQPPERLTRRDVGQKEGCDDRVLSSS